MPAEKQQTDLEHHISVSFFRRLVEVLRHEPRDTLVMAFAQAGLDFDQFKRHPEQHTATDLIGLLHVLNQSQYFPGVVIKFGMSRDILDLGILGYTILSCRDIRQAMEMVTRYHSLTADAYDMTMSIEEDRVYSRQWVKPGHLEHRVEIDEEHVTGVWRLMRLLLPESLSMDDVVVQLAYSAPRYIDLYRQVFSCDLDFDQRVTCINYPSAWLDFPIQTADETVEKVCRKQCEMVLQKLSLVSSVVDDVRRLILSVPSNRGLKIEDIAATMLLTVRTLERRLQAAGTGFRTIDNEVRMGLAAEYIRLGYISNKEIAYMLNYSQPSTFYRAFKNWFGITPGAYRRANSVPLGSA